MDEFDVPVAEYRWEGGTGNLWDSEIAEDEHGNIVSGSLQGKQHRSLAGRVGIDVAESVRRGLIRYMVLALDCGSAAAEIDYRPNRLMAVKHTAERFIAHYFDQNPISQLSLAIIQDGAAQKLTDMSGNPRLHVEKLRKLRTTVGVSSLQNTIKLAVLSLRHVPSYGHRELLIVYNSLSSIDPGDIDATIEDAVNAKIRISIICLSAEIFICKKITQETNGTFAVAIDGKHLQELMNSMTSPSPELQQNDTIHTDFVYMGFPKRETDSVASHVYDGKTSSMACTYFICPRCYTKTVDIPTRCFSCTLQLNSSSHIARSFHHIFPVPHFLVVSTDQLVNKLAVGVTNNGDVANTSTSTSTSASNMMEIQDVQSTGNSNTTTHNQRKAIIPCDGCSEFIHPNGDVFQCPNCSQAFCSDCDNFVHGSLHNCPGCTVLL